MSDPSAGPPCEQLKLHLRAGAVGVAMKAAKPQHLRVGTDLQMNGRGSERAIYYDDVFFLKCFLGGMLLDVFCYFLFLLGGGGGKNSGWCVL